MINTDYAKKILDAFFNADYNSKSESNSGNTITTAQLNDRVNNAIKFPNTPYLALFTQMPAADGTGSAEPTVSDYNRVLLTTIGPKTLQLMGKATVEEGTDDYAGKNVAVIQNQDIIVYPENETVDYDAPIVGFGVFSAKTGGTPYLWGELTESVTITAGEIPVFRIGEFVFKLA